MIVRSFFRDFNQEDIPSLGNAFKTKLNCRKQNHERVKTFQVFEI